jgi:hypothetical protein
MDDIEDEESEPPTSAFVRDRLAEAQITMVSVLPIAVAKSFLRQH